MPVKALHSTSKLTKPERRALQLEAKVLKRLTHIRNNPRHDRYGRPVPDGSPIGMGDRNWLKHYGIGGHSSVKTPILGIGVARDSYLQSSYRENEKLAKRILQVDKHTPRSTKITTEIKKWVQQHHLNCDAPFMAQLIQVSKRVKPISSLQRAPFNIPIECLKELQPLVYKFANYALLDARQMNAHFGVSTREQMAKAQLFKSMGVLPEGACEVTYTPKYKAFDKLEPRVPMLQSTREQMTKAQLFKSMGNPGLGSECHPSVPYNPTYNYLSSEPSSVSACFGKPSGNPTGKPTKPVWKQIKQKKEKATEKLAREKEMERLLHQKRSKELERVHQAKSKSLYDFVDDSSLKKNVPWTTPMEPKQRQRRREEQENELDNETVGSLDTFLLPKMLKTKNMDGKTRSRRTSQSYSNLLGKNQSKINRYGSKPTPQRYVKDWSKRHARPIKIVVKKRNPEEMADSACQSHLATVQRCQPTEWLSPYGGDDHGQHLHATTGTNNKDWMGDEWLDEDEYGDIDEEKLLHFGESVEEQQEEQEQRYEQQLHEQHIEEADDRARKKLELEKLEKQSVPLNQLLFPPKHQAMVNAIARRTEFFGKCRIVNKLARQSLKKVPGRIASRATKYEKHSHVETPRTAAIAAAYHSGIVPRFIPMSFADVQKDGICDLSHRSMNSNVLVTYLERVHAASITSSIKDIHDVKILLLNDSRLNDTDAALIIAMLAKLKKIERIDLSNNKLGMHTAEALIHLTQSCPALVELFLSGTLAQHSLASKTLLSGWQTSQFIKLDLSHNRISSLSSIKQISRLVATTTVLEHLNLGWNNFGAKGGVLVTKSLLANKSLKYLSLSFNGIGDQSIAILAQGVSKHPSLLTINVDGNSFGDDAALRLANAMLCTLKERKNSGGGGTMCKALMRHNKISQNVTQQLLGKTFHDKRTNRGMMLEIFPVIVGDGEGSVDPTVSVVYQVPR